MQKDEKSTFFDIFQILKNSTTKLKLNITKNFFCFLFRDEFASLRIVVVFEN